MSSLTRRIQVRAFKKVGRLKQPIVSDRGNVLGMKWPVTKGQIFFLANMRPVFPFTEHPTLQGVIAALSQQQEPVAEAA